MKDFSKYKLNLKPSPKDKRDLKVSAVLREIELPPRTNNRTLMFAVRDQMEQGSCAAMAGAGMKEYQEVKDYGLKAYLSPQFIYNSREDPNEEGMYLRDLMKILQNRGVCFEKLYPYLTMKKPSAEALANALNFRIDNYAAIDSMYGLKLALHIKGPCVIAVPVYNYTERMWAQRPGDNFLGGHAMLAVDYDDDTETILIRNSWSEEWGDEGYCKMSYMDYELMWEAWSSIDAESAKTTTDTPVTTPAPHEGWFKRWGVWILLGITVVVISLFLSKWFAG